MTQPEVSLGEIERIAAGQHHDPHSVLGAHPGPDGVIIRALRPLAKSVTAVLDDGRRIPMTHLHQGVFEVTVPDEKVPGYRIAATYPDASGAEGPEEVRDDPYRYLPTLGEFDLYLIGEGRHEELWRVLGAHVREVGQTTGTSFAVWAPNAHGVRVTGDFNYWDGSAYPMRSLGGSGVWELFIPGVTDGARYKYAICAPDGVWREKADPMANAAEKPPATASVVYTSQYTWDDEDWVTARAESALVREPVSIYEVHLGSWRPGLSYRAARGATRSPRTTRRHRGSAARTTSVTWSTRCTRPASA
jgi:1,4-alpha-glucan branching enzyme